MSEATPQAYTIVESEVISERPLDGLSEHNAPLPPRLLKGIFWLLSLSMFALPLWFGAVHESFYLPVFALFYFALAAVCWQGAPALREAFAPGSMAKRGLLLLSLFASYAIIQGITFSIIKVPHPVVGSIPLLPDSPAYLTAMSSILFFIAAFVLIRTLLQTVPRFHSRLLSLVVWSGVTVSLVALSHWFHDNGKLFWTFEPEHMHLSERARWPFVNPNHLGHFLMPIFFLLVARLTAQVEKFRAIYQEDQARDRKTLSSIAQSSRLQRNIIRIAFTLCFTLATLLCIFGTLSRGTWLGVCVAALCYYVLSRNLSLPDTRQQLHAVDDNDGSRRRRSSRHRSSPKRASFSFAPILSSMRRLGRPLFILLAAVLLIFFLSERGRDLVAQRIDYGLLYSKDDMRWQLYSDTMPMLEQHIFFGVGLGGWDALYKKDMASQLSGMEPVYLHSDPLQILTECGLLGMLPLLALIGIVVAGGVKRVRVLSSIQTEQARTLAALLSAGIGLLVASFLDFPFRIPAIVFFAACYFALTTFYCDEEAFTSR